MRKECKKWKGVEERTKRDQKGEEERIKVEIERGAEKNGQEEKQKGENGMDSKTDMKIME